jgi:hypothetical protein
MEADLFPLGLAKDLLVLQDCMNNAANIKGVNILTKYIEARPSPRRRMWRRDWRGA